MRLTKQNAHLYEGKTLGAHKRTMSHHPLTVQRNKQGELIYFDCAGVGMIIPDEKDLLNAVYFDFVVGEEQLNAEPKHSTGESHRA